MQYVGFKITIFVSLVKPAELYCQNLIYLGSRYRFLKVLVPVSSMVNKHGDGLNQYNNWHSVLVYKASVLLRQRF